MANVPEAPLIRAPIALQLVALLLVGLIAAVAMIVAVVVLLPPPLASAYRLGEVAVALRGGRTTFVEGALVRTLVARPPIDQPADERSKLMQRLLAEQVKAPLNSVRLLLPSPPLPFGPRPGGAAGAPPLGFGPYSGQSAPWPGPLAEDRRAEAAPIFGAFVAAMQMADGRWVVVRPPPERFPNDWQLRILLWLAGCMAVIVPAAYLFARRITAPIARFADAAERLGRDPRQPSMSLSGPAEIGKAAAAFNRMQERLRRYIDDRTAMVGAISHDLRTPLTRIRFRIESGPQDLKTAVGLDLDRMEAMIAAVLAFIRDASEPGYRERLDLRSLVECVVDDAALMGHDARIIGPAQAYAVEADEAALIRLFSNLVQNAITYAGGAEIRLSEDDDCIVVAVCDNGPGLSDGELERVFQPFYRAEAARTLTDGGVGLGLAIARSIARAHGGDVTLRSREPHGLTAEVSLPRCNPAGTDGSRLRPSALHRSPERLPSS